MPTTTCRAAATPGTTGLVLVLAGLAAVSPFATDMYTPGFPAIADAFGTEAGAIQLSLTACLAGTAAGQLVLGPLSDARGRRTPLLIGSAGFTVLSLACAAAPSVAFLDVARLVQGFAGSAGLVIARAVVRDRFDGVAAVRRFSVLGVVSMTAPVLAPVLGGLVLGLGSWRLVFVVLAAGGAVLTFSVACWVPESLPAPLRRTGGARTALLTIRSLLGRREMVGYLLVAGCGLGALFAYISGSPFVFQRGYGLTPGTFSLVFAVNAVGTLLSAATTGRLAGRVRLNTLVSLGLAVTALALAVLVAAEVVGLGSFALTWVCLFGLTTGFGLVLPASISVVLAIGGHAPGAASGLLGGTQFLLGALATPLPDLLGGTTTLSTGGVALGFTVVAGTALLVLARPWLGHGEPTRSKGTP